MSDLPKRTNIDSADKIKTFFNKFYEPSGSYKAGEVDAVIGYFLKRGFDEISAINTANVILQQALNDKINVNKLIDTLEGINDVQLSAVIAEILNINRDKTSQLGFKSDLKTLNFESRNIKV